MVPQVSERRIGNVMIVDIKGDLSGSWAVRGRDQIAQARARNSSCKLIFNLRETTSLDTLGVKSILENIPEGGELAVIPGSSGVLDLVKRCLKNKRFYIYQDERGIASAFGPDFVAAETLAEQRESVRLETAFPLEFYFEDEGERLEFRAIVTNLSESGLFAEYIDLNAAEESLKRLDPYDLKLLHLKLLLPMRKPVETDGNVMHRRLDGEQVGIGIKFTGIGEKEVAEIRNFLKSHNVHKRYAKSNRERKVT